MVHVSAIINAFFAAFRTKGFNLTLFPKTTAKIVTTIIIFKSLTKPRNYDNLFDQNILCARCNHYTLVIRHNSRVNSLNSELSHLTFKTRQSIPFIDRFIFFVEIHWLHFGIQMKLQSNLDLVYGTLKSFEYWVK